MRLPWIIVPLLFVADCVHAQVPAPPSPWGGYAVPQPVPYQPTLGEPASAGGNQPVVTLPASGVMAPYVAQPAPGPAYTLSGPVALPSQAPDTNVAQPWQAYPAPGAPANGAYLAPQQPIYPATPEPSLRESLIPPDARDGFFQKAKFTATWLPQLDDDNLGWTDLRSEIVTALPFFTRENPIIITPSYELHFLDRPAGLDLPPRLHDLAIDFHVFRVYDNHWIADFAVTPGLFADDYSFDSNDALRLNGRAVGIYAPTLDWKWVLGVTYVNGGWAKIVPVAGVVYEPNDDVKYELVFPRPRIAWRLPNSPIPGRDEYWFYVLAEFATSVWAFQQNDATADVLAYRDYRLVLGLERKIIGGLSSRLELGYVFHRDMKIASNGPDEISLGDTFLLRAGVVY